MEPIQFGNFTLMERISHGGMAEVFRAKSFGEAGFEREVALKVLLPAIATDKEFVNMLIDEAKIAGQLNHANIAQIFDLGVADSRYYIVQEYVKGQDLRAILRLKHESKQHLTVSKACYIALKVCEGLHYAHNKGDSAGRPLNLVHRDISPHNILISDEGEVKIIDFGIAKAEGRATETMAGLVKGKFAYMSPEQIRGLPVDHRSDVFATGILLHEMLTTKPLFRRKSEFETLKLARAAIAPRPSQINPLVPPALDVIVLKALARHVDDRYQSAQELRDALWTFAKSHNAFQIDERTDTITGLGDEDSDLSIELEIASEVSAAYELSLEAIAPDETNPGFSAVLDESQDTAPEDSVELVEADAIDDSAHLEIGASDFIRLDADEEEYTENATVVDPKLPFGMPGLLVDKLEEELENEHTIENHGHGEDELWAANARSPLKARQSRPTPGLLGVTIDDETTSDRVEDALTPTPTEQLQAFDEVTVPQLTTPTARKPTKPNRPVRPLANQLSDAAETFQHASFDEKTVRKPGPVKVVGPTWSSPNSAQPAKASKSTVLGMTPVPTLSPNRPPTDSVSPPASAFGQRTDSGSAPLPMPPPAQSDHQLPSFQLAQQQQHPPSAFAQTESEDPRSAFAQAESEDPHVATPTPDSPKPQSSQRLYLLMFALFVLLLAGAASITLVVTS